MAREIVGGRCRARTWRSRAGAGHFLRSGELRWETLDPRIEIYDRDVPDAGTYRGPDGFLDWIAPRYV